ncbi:MAG TPA: hypothetical protein P5150_09430, partial [Candidatus Ratteibacteria bacterium]|nr:hypothetical protein [Candidatus Ratteibacteria bacterium]
MEEIKEINFSNESTGSFGQAQIIYGQMDKNLKLLEKLLDVEIIGRGNSVKIKGEKEKVEKAIEIFEILKKYVRNKKVIEKEEILKLIGEKAEKQEEKKDDFTIHLNSKKKIVVPKS